MVDNARLPESPVSPNRPLIILMGALVGLGVGIGLVALLEQMDKSLRSEDDVTSVLRLPVLAVIPAIETRRDRRRRKRGHVLAVASTATATVILAGATVLVLAAKYLPLPMWLR